MRMLILLTGCLCLLGGCSESEQSNVSKTSDLEVEVFSNPKKVKLLEPVKITALVTSDGVEVSEKAEVEFELIKKDSATIGYVTPDYIGDGKYQIETIFDEEGVYQIVSHVSLGNDHEMPIYEINVSP
jgi:hypothetical protein